MADHRSAGPIGCLPEIPFAPPLNPRSAVYARTTPGAAMPLHTVLDQGLAAKYVHELREERGLEADLRLVTPGEKPADTLEG